jgi:hypothetical protein
MTPQRNIEKKPLGNRSFISLFLINNRKINFAKVLKSYFKILFGNFIFLEGAGLDNFERNN